MEKRADALNFPVDNSRWWWTFFLMLMGVKQQQHRNVVLNGIVSKTDREPKTILVISWDPMEEGEWYQIFSVAHEWKTWWLRKGY